MTTPTYVGLSSTFNNNATTGSVTNATSVAVGDLLVALILVDGGNNSQITPGLTDNKNTGAWNLPAGLNIYGTNNVGGGYYEQIVGGWIRCDTAAAAGALILSMTGLQATDQQLMLLQFTNFTTGHPSLVTADIHSNQGTGTALSLASFNNSATNEVLVQASTQYLGGNTYTGLSGGFTNVNSFNSVNVGYAIETTSGNALSFAATGTASTPWITMAFGFQDVNPALVPGQGSLAIAGQNAGLSRGTVLTPQTAKVRHQVRNALRDLGRAIFLPPYRSAIRV